MSHYLLAFFFALKDKRLLFFFTADFIFLTLPFADNRFILTPF